MVKEGEELTKVSVCKIFLPISQFHSHLKVTLQFKIQISIILYSKVIATDLDDPATDDNGVVTYSLESGQEHFKIDPQSGLVTAKVTLERGIWRAGLIAEDGGGLTGAATLVVIVGEVEEEVEEEVEKVDEEDVKGERRRRFLMDQQTRLDTLDSYCSTKQQWPGLNSNVIYVLQVMHVKVVAIMAVFMIMMRGRGMAVIFKMDI